MGGKCGYREGKHGDEGKGSRKRDKEAQRKIVGWYRDHKMIATAIIVSD
jgi:hypothetical protein